MGSMKIILTIVFALTLAQGTTPADYNRTERSSHFIINYNSPETSVNEAQVVATAAESEYEKLVRFLGKEQSPEKIVIFLEGPAFNTKTQKFSYPSADKSGHLHLYRFPGETFPYSEAIAHELVHVFRTMTWPAKSEQNYMTGFGFVEEGFAEFVSIQTSPDFKGFVRYGFPLEIVVGFLLEDQKGIPLDILFDHHEINPKCIAQAYPLRASFFQFLYDTYGKEKVFRLAYYNGDLNKAAFLEIFEVSFETLTARWQSYAEQKYTQYPDHGALKKAYLETTPIIHVPFCKSGTDW